MRGSIQDTGSKGKGRGNAATSGALSPRPGKAGKGSLGAYITLRGGVVMILLFLCPVNDFEQMCN